MRRYVDYIGKINEVRLLLNHPAYKNKLFVILEGETDIRLFRSLLKSEHISLDAFDGKFDLIRIVKTLNREDSAPVIGVCDADFDHIKNRSAERMACGICITDFHDAETMMFNSSSINSFIDEYSNHENYNEISENLYNITIDAACKIGVLRLINEEENINMNFKGLNFNSFINIEMLKIDLNIEELIRSIIRISRLIPEYANFEYLLEKYNIVYQENHDKLQLCCGHDITKIVAMVYSQRWAACVGNMNKEKVEQALRIGYSFEEFKQTNLYENFLDAAQRLGFNDPGNTIFSY